MKTFSTLLLLCLQSYIASAQSLAIRPAVNFGYATNTIHAAPANDAGFSSPQRIFSSCKPGVGISVEYSFKKQHAVELSISRIPADYLAHFNNGRNAVQVTGLYLTAVGLYYNYTLNTPINLKGWQLRPFIGIGVGTIINRSSDAYKRKFNEESYTAGKQSTDTSNTGSVWLYKVNELGLTVSWCIGMKLYNKQQKERLALSLNYSAGFIDMAYLEGYYYTGTPKQRNEYTLASKGSTVFLSLSTPLTIYRKLQDIRED
ncbi:MAG TPA: hypothetical protein VGD89_10875 [Flavipsychrobacter sp.]